VVGRQPVAWAAWMMTLATTPGLEIIDRWGALISVMRAQDTTSVLTLRNGQAMQPAAVH
jgi:hypothetical protein